MKDPATNQVFFSYRRSDGTENVKELKKSFEACSGLKAFVDVDELRSGNFQEKLRAVIAEAHSMKNRFLILCHIQKN